MTFETGLLPSGLALPAVPLIFGLIALASDAIAVGLGLGGIGFGLLGLYVWSRVRIHQDGAICVRMYSIRMRCLSPNEIRWIHVQSSEIFPRAAPAIRIEAADGRRVTLRLGCWRRESELLRRLEAISAPVEAHTDSRTRQLFRRRPSGRFWERRNLPRGPRARPFKRRGIELLAYTCGLATCVLGLILVVLTDQTRPGIGALGSVPEAVIGLNAIVLGLMAVLMARPRRELKRIAGTVWLPLGVAVVVTVATIITALSEVAPRLMIDRRIAAIFLTLGFASQVLTFTFGFLALVLRIIGAAWRRLVGDRLD
jgi:hypothetical protein